MNKDLRLKWSKNIMMTYALRAAAIKQAIAIILGQNDQTYENALNTLSQVTDQYKL